MFTSTLPWPCNSRGSCIPPSGKACNPGQKGDRQVAVHRRDGLEFLSALFPPAIRHRLVLVDPACEVKDEYDRLPAARSSAIRKWGEGIYAVWYPVLRACRHDVEWLEEPADWNRRGPRSGTGATL